MFSIRKACGTVHHLLGFLGPRSVGAYRLRTRGIVQIDQNIPLRGILLRQQFNACALEGVHEGIAVRLGVVHIRPVIPCCSAGLRRPGAVVHDSAVIVVDIDRPGNRCTAGWIAGQASARLAFSGSTR
ncbi:hypothetical protein D3C81_1375160 [compost metagenome]